MKAKVTALNKTYLVEFRDENQFVSFLTQHNEKINNIEVLDEEAIPALSKPVEVAKPSVSDGWKTLEKSAFTQKEKGVDKKSMTLGGKYAEFHYEADKTLDASADSKVSKPKSDSPAMKGEDIKAPNMEKAEAPKEEVAVKKPAKEEAPVKEEAKEAPAEESKEESAEKEEKKEKVTEGVLFEEDGIENNEQSNEQNAQNNQANPENKQILDKDTIAANWVIEQVKTLKNYNKILNREEKIRIGKELVSVACFALDIKNSNTVVEKVNSEVGLFESKCCGKKLDEDMLNDAETEKENDIISNIAEDDSDIKLNQISENLWDYEANGLTFEVSMEEDGKYMVDVFKSEDDEGNETEGPFNTLDDAKEYIKDRTSVSELSNEDEEDIDSDIEDGEDVEPVKYNEDDTLTED